MNEKTSDEIKSVPVPKEQENENENYKRVNQLK